MTRSLIGEMKPNPDFGKGEFTRAVALKRLSARHLVVGLEDAVHAFLLHVHHDEARLTHIEGQWIRAPFSACTGAPAALSLSQETALQKDLRALSIAVDVQHQCTHLFDALRLAIVHIAQQRPDRRYDVVMPDVVDGLTPVRLYVDGILQREMMIDKENMRIATPEAYAGRPILRGFAAWAQTEVDADEYELLFLLQRAIFVSISRWIDMPFYYNKPATLSGPPENTCFGAQNMRFHQSMRLANTLHEGTRPEMLLHFMPSA